MPNVVETRPAIEEYDLPDAAAESELAVAEHLLAGLLIRSWMARRQHRQETQRELGSQDGYDL